MQSDSEIIDKADKWKEKQFKLKEEALHLRHKRWWAFGRFLKYSIMVLAGCAAVVGAGFGINFACDANEETKKQEALQQAEFERQQVERIEAYEKAWVRCVEQVSLEECDLIRGVSHDRGFEDGYENRKKRQ